MWARLVRNVIHAGGWTSIHHTLLSAIKDDQMLPRVKSSTADFFPPYIRKGSCRRNQTATAGAWATFLEVRERSPDRAENQIKPQTVIVAHFPHQNHFCYTIGSPRGQYVFLNLCQQEFPPRFARFVPRICQSAPSAGWSALSLTSTTTGGEEIMQAHL